MKVRDHDFPDEELGKITPYGVYDIAANRGFVSVGTSCDTGAFAVNALRLWWQQEGAARYPHATRLLVTCDSGGSNGGRCRLWKDQLAALAAQTGLRIEVCHFPPATARHVQVEQNRAPDAGLPVGAMSRRIASKTTLNLASYLLSSSSRRRARSSFAERIYLRRRVCQIFCARGFFAVRFRVFIRNHFLALSDAVLPGLSRGSAEPDFPCRSGADAACPGFPGVLCCCGCLLPDPPGIAWRAFPSVIKYSGR